MTGAKKPAAKMTSTGSAKKTTVSRGSKTGKQVGDQNQRENYNANRDKINIPGVRSITYSMQGTGHKTSKDDVKAASKMHPNNYRYTSASRTAQRAGGNAASKSTGKSNPSARTRSKAARGS